MAERLFNRWGAMDSRGLKISDAIAQVIKMTWEENPDVDVNDLEGVIMQTVGAEMAVIRLRRATKMRKAERQNSANL